MNRPHCAVGFPISRNQNNKLKNAEQRDIKFKVKLEVANLLAPVQTSRQAVNLLVRISCYVSVIGCAVGSPKWNCFYLFSGSLDVSDVPRIFVSWVSLLLPPTFSYLKFSFYDEIFRSSRFFPLIIFELFICFIT